MNIFEKIKKQINKYPILLYMKGSPSSPQCGFSALTAKILSSYKKKFFYIDVLNNQDIREFLPKYSNWPTFPQLWINRKLIGGCDIVSEMHKSKELELLILNIK